jgi:hypothetical protein
MHVDGTSTTYTRRREYLHPFDRPLPASIWDENPYNRLLQGLKQIVQDADSLPTACQFTRDQLLLVENAPRHDTVLDDATWKAVWGPPYYYRKLGPFARPITALKVSLANLMDAAEAARGQFRGQEKVRTEDRLARHVTEAQGLLAHFKQLQSELELPRQPYLIRQQSLSGLLSGIVDLLEQVMYLRKQLQAADYPDGLFVILTEQECAVRRLMGTVARLRDNPSQKMAEKLGQCLTRATAIKETLSGLKDAARAECKRQGMKFTGRCGEEID